MLTDKSWVHLNKSLSRYEKGVDDVLDIAFSCPRVEDMIRCPCHHCHNFYHLTREDVKYHLLYYEMDDMYDPWVHRGEGKYHVIIFLS